MAINVAAEQPDVVENLHEDLKNEDSHEKNQDKVDLSKLSSKEVNDLEEGKITFRQIARERNQKAQAAEAELGKLATATAEQNNIIDLREYKELKKQIEDTQSADKMDDILDYIRDLPDKKEKQKQQEADEAQEVPLDHPKLEEQVQKFEKICEDNKNVIGLKQVPGFKKWIKEELKKKPTIGYAKELVKRLEGKQVQDRGGLAPRREEFKTLERLFQKYGINSPLESNYIKQEGLSERQEFRRNAEQLEDHLEKVRDTGFYSKEAIGKTMQEMLKQDSPSAQKSFLNNAKNIARSESQGFTYLDSRMSVAGVSMRKMSSKSKDSYQSYYKNLTLQERRENLPNWEKLVENEEALAKHVPNNTVYSLYGVEPLEKIYANDQENLKVALQSFGNLDFMQKVQALKEHKKLVEKAGSKEELQKELTLKAAQTSIDEAARKHIISASTQKKYKEWFGKEENFKNPKTKQTGDLGEMKKAYEILTSSTPDAKAKNIIAYQIKRDRFVKELKDFKVINPDMKEEELQKWQDKYDKAGWTDRKKVYKEMIKEKEKEEKAQEKKKEAEKAADISEDDKEKIKTMEVPERAEAIRSAIELINEDQAAEALKVLLAYNDEHPDDPDIVFWMEVAMKRIKEFGSGKKLEKTQEKIIEEEVKNVVSTDEGIKDSIEEENILNLNLQGVRQSEDRLKSKTAQERAKKDMAAKSTSGNLEDELKEEFYEQTDSEHVIDMEEDTGEELTRVDFSDTAYTDNERQELKEATREKTSRLHKKEGFTHAKLVDKTGHEITSDEAEVHQAKNLEALEEQIAEKALDKAQAKTEGGLGGKVYDLSARIAAKRKARDIIDDETNRIDKLAA